MVKWIKKHWEVLSYLVFGVLCTLLNIVLYALFNKLFGYTAANSWGNVLDNILCILFAYATNRAFVFRSKTTGKAMAKEFGTFVTCRLGTMLLDTAIMLVLCDDITQAPGKLRIRPSGSAGGHNGLKSIIARLGGENFPRIRIGIGAKPHPDYDLAAWVLGKFPPEDAKAITDRYADLEAAAKLIMDGKLSLAQSKYNG